LLSVDEVFGPAFIKVSAYFPYPIKIWLNGHEYAKRQARAAEIGSPNWTTGSPPPMIPLHCSASATR
jgi:hypothetical protein